MKPGIGVRRRRIGLLPLLGFLLVAGCASIQVSSKFEPNQSLPGKTVVLEFRSHDRLQNMSDVMELKLRKILFDKGVKVISFRQSGLSLSDDAGLDFAKEKKADYLFVYALTGGTVIRGQGLSALTSEGLIVNIQSGKPVWKGSLDFSNPGPLPGSYGKAVKQILQSLIGKLEEDGFFPSAAGTPGSAPAPI